MFSEHVMYALNYGEMNGKWRVGVWLAKHNKECGGKGVGWVHGVEEKKKERYLAFQLKWMRDP